VTITAANDRTAFSNSAVSDRRLNICENSQLTLHNSQVDVRGVSRPGGTDLRNAFRMLAAQTRPTKVTAPIVTTITDEPRATAASRAGTQPHTTSARPRFDSTELEAGRRVVPCAMEPCLLPLCA
jgi:hypothetical protein